MMPMQSKNIDEIYLELCYNIAMSCSGLSQRKDNEYERKK